MAGFSFIQKYGRKASAFLPLAVGESNPISQRLPLWRLCMLIFVSSRLRLLRLCLASGAPAAMGTASAVAAALPLLFPDNLPNNHADDEQRRKNNNQYFIPLHKRTLRPTLNTVVNSFRPFRLPPPKRAFLPPRQ